jgi:two-component system, NtrC family, sensor histidine kinase HydH
MPGQSHAYDLLRRFLQVLTTALPTDNKLDQILLSISEFFQSDRTLLLKPDQIDPDGLFAGVVSEKEALWVEDGASFSRANVRPGEEAFLSAAFVCLPLSDGDSFLGIVYLGFSKPRSFLAEEADLLFLIAKGIGEILRNAALYLEAEQTISELTALHTLGKAMTSTLNLDDLLELILRSGLKILEARGGVVRLEDRGTGALKVRFSIGGYDQNPLDEQMAQRVFISQTPLSLNHFDQEKPSLSILYAPLFSKGRCLGTLAFYEKEVLSQKFDERDFQLLLTMANQIACAIENALTHDETFRLVQDHEKSLRQLSTLCELNKTLLTTVHLDRILQMTLTAITIREGLGFNRAMLFMVDEKDHVLRGTMAVGPDTAEEAGRIWEALAKRKGSPSEIIPQMEPPAERTSQIDLLVKGTEIPLKQSGCILANTVLEGSPFNVRIPPSGAGGPQSGCEGICKLHSELGCRGGENPPCDPRSYAFATVPLWGKGRVLGVILVDNLFNQSPIEDKDVQFLSMFANQAGLAIENALLYRNLEDVHHELKEAQAQIVHREKMGALGELSNTVAHEIKNPLTAIGGFARRLDRTLPVESPEKRYTQTIIQEVNRLEKVLGDINHYTHEEAVVYHPQDLAHILEDCLSSIFGEWGTGKIDLIRDYADRAPKMMGDYLQLKQAFYNLIKNACESMDQKGTLFLRLYPFSKNGTSYVRLEVKDTGRGIDPENLPNIFNPFYSTKDSSLGLGLPMVHKIIASHKGQIEVDNRPGEGVTFRITFPALEEEVRNPTPVLKKPLPLGQD